MWNNERSSDILRITKLAEIKVTIEENLICIQTWGCGASSLVSGAGHWWHLRVNYRAQSFDFIGHICDLNSGFYYEIHISLHRLSIHLIWFRSEF